MVVRKLSVNNKKQQTGLIRIMRKNRDKKLYSKIPYLIFENGIDMTPKALQDPLMDSYEKYVSTGKSVSVTPHSKRGGKLHERSVSLDTLSKTSSIITMTSRYSRFSDRKSLKSQHSLILSVASVEVCSKEDISFSAALEESETDEDLASEDRAPSMFRLREDPPPISAKVNTKFEITIAETNPICFLQLPTASEIIDSEQGEIIAELNTAYNKGMEKIKAVSNVATQTTSVFHKNRKLQMHRNSRRNSSTFASVWEMYDTYLSLQSDSVRASWVSTTREVGMVEHILTSEENKDYDEEFEYRGQIFNSRFLNALMIMERIVYNDIYRDSQLMYNGMLLQDPFSTSVTYNYNLIHLWTFKCSCVKNKCVASITWNHKNTNIMAVGYGKFKFTTKCDGLVCIWNIKNPNSPERLFEFPADPVTFVSFGNVRWQILAVAFYSGAILLIDIISRSLLVRANNHHYPLFYPVRQARWFPPEPKSTVLVASGKSGKVYRYKKNQFFLSNRIMSVSRPHGKIQGVEQPKKCFARKVLSSRQPAAETLVKHPSDPLLYLVGSSEGYVYICSLQHRYEYIDSFVAHNGPVYSIQFNPFSSKVFLTCGADWCIRIWAEMVYEPLITLQSGMVVVQNALWSPLHSTVIVSITGTFIEIWDIRRRISKPMSTMQTPSKSQNTSIHFTNNKFNICIGDIDGNVHVMALSEMPFSPNYQESVLVEAIFAALITRPKTVETLRRQGPPFVHEDNDTDKTRFYRKIFKLSRNNVQ